MSYLSLEQSKTSSRPVELFRFIRGNKTWGYTNAQSSIEYQSQIFTSTSIKRDSIKLTSDIFKDNLKIELPSTNVLAADILVANNSQGVTLTILRGNVGDTEYITYWKGRVIGAEVMQTGTISINCESVYTSIRRNGLSAKFEYGCRHPLYSVGCGANRELFLVEGNIASFDSAVKLLVPAASSKPNGWFTGGIAIFSNGNSRFITSHTGSTIVISVGNVGVSAGTPVKLYPGCNHSLTTCIEKFGNGARFGGFPWIPSKNPYGGSSIV